MNYTTDIKTCYYFPIKEAWKENTILLFLESVQKKRIGEILSIDLKNKLKIWKKGRTGNVHTGRRLTDKGSLFKNVQLTSMCIPGLILLFCFSYLPMYGLILAFKNYKFADGIWGSEWVGLKNFEFLFKSDVLGRLLRNTLGYNMLFLIGNTVVTVVFAILLYEIKNKTFINK